MWTTLSPNLRLLLGLVFVDKLAMNLVVPLLPFHLAKLTENDATIGYLASLFSLTQLLGAPLMGRLSDTFGRSQTLAFCFLASNAGYLLMGWAPTLPIIFLACGLVGLVRHSPSLGAAYVTASSSVLDRVQSLSYLGTASGLGLIVGPAIGGLLHEHNPNLPTAICCLLLCINFFLCYFYLPEPSRSSISSPSSTADDQLFYSDKNDSTKTEATDATAESSSVVIAINKLEADKQKADSLYEADSPRDVCFDGMTTSGQSFFSGMWNMLTQSNLLFFFLVSFCCNLVFSMFQSCFTVIGKQRFGMDAQMNGVLLSYIGAILVFVQVFVVGSLANRIRENLLIQLTLLCLGSSLFLTSLAPSLSVLMLLMLPLVLSHGIIKTCTLSSITKSVRKADAGGAIGVAKAVDNVARVLGPSFGGLLLEFSGTRGPGFFGGTLLAFASLFLFGGNHYGFNGRLFCCGSLRKKYHQKASSGMHDELLLPA
ncbi:hypothetical protein QOT17_009607 [Balamuthia mandrillaris]